jgi:hypothetical protein
LSFFLKKMSVDRKISGDLSVYGVTQSHGSFFTYGGFHSYGPCYFHTDIVFAGNLEVGGSINVIGDIDVGTDLRVANDLEVTNNFSVEGDSLFGTDHGSVDFTAYTNPIFYGNQFTIYTEEEHPNAKIDLFLRRGTSNGNTDWRIAVDPTIWGTSDSLLFISGYDAADNGAWRDPRVMINKEGYVPFTVESDELLSGKEADISQVILHSLFIEDMTDPHGINWNAWNDSGTYKLVYNEFGAVIDFPSVGGGYMNFYFSDGTDGTPTAGDALTSIMAMRYDGVNTILYMNQGLPAGAGNAIGITGGNKIVDISSTRTVKEHIEIWENDGSWLLDCPVYKFAYISDKQEEASEVGLMAEDTSKIFPDKKDYIEFKNSSGILKAYKEKTIIASLIKLCQKQQHEIDMLKAQVKIIQQDKGRVNPSELIKEIGKKLTHIRL